MIEAALAFLVGLILGSFLNVCIYRLPRDLSVVKPRSHCPACEKMIAWYDNVPLVSYALLGGRCRHCRERIPARYPIVELLTAVAFFLIVLKFGPTLAAVKMCLFSALLIGLVFADLETMILPDEFTLGGALAGIGLAAVVPLKDPYLDWFLAMKLSGVALSMVEATLSAALPSLLLWGLGAAFMAIRKREGLGLGDVKMIAMVGAFTGITGAIFTVMIGSIAGSVIGLIYIRLKHKDASTTELPFGTFLGAAALAVPYLVPAIR
jgi:leader peptidase (prepilin peptidase)/N-methyltransferase